MKRASDVPPEVDSFGLPAGHLGDRADHRVGERARLGVEHVGVRRLPVDRPAHLAAGRLRRALLDQRLAATRSCGNR